MAKIKVKNPAVELDGDEMTRIIWADIKPGLIPGRADLRHMEDLVDADRQDGAGRESGRDGTDAAPRAPRL